MILNFIFILVASFAIFWSIKVKKLFPAIISCGMVAGIVMTQFLAKAQIIYGIYVYLIFVCLVFLYAFTTKGRTFLANTIIVIISSSIFLYWIWVLNHWHGNTILFPLFVLTAAAVGIISKVKLKNELGFLAILYADAIAILLEQWMESS
ncbi:MAG: hypothetical protein Q8T08_18880 [Ignavibacteria bacterium]|nr:hypothetical protein [Ignavibacteria bacterium]